MLASFGWVESPISLSSSPIVLSYFKTSVPIDEALIRKLFAAHSRNSRNYGRPSDSDAEYETSDPQCVGPTHLQGTKSH